MKHDLTILAVEDETAVAQFLALVLCGPNCKVITAGDGREALIRFDSATRPYDVVITDHKMPRMSGLELVRELRQRQFEGKIAVLSAHLTEPNRRAYEDLHVDLMLAKPFDIDELRRAVDVLTSEARVLAGQSTG